jgi:hypothetical protein
VCIHQCYHLLSLFTYVCISWNFKYVFGQIILVKWYLIQLDQIILQIDNLKSLFVAHAGSNEDSGSAVNSAQAADC